MNSINGALISIIMSKDLPDDLKRTNLLTGMMLGENQNALFAQVLNIKQQKESQDKIDELETKVQSCKDTSLLVIDEYIVKTVNEYISKSKDTRRDEIADLIASILKDYIKTFHKGILPKSFKKLNEKVLVILEDSSEIEVPESVNGVAHNMSVL